MFILFDGILLNENSVVEIKRVPIKTDEMLELSQNKPFGIELNRAMQKPMYEFFQTKEQMQSRWEKLKDKVGCSDTGGL